MNTRPICYIEVAGCQWQIFGNDSKMLRNLGSFGTSPQLSAIERPSRNVWKCIEILYGGYIAGLLIDRNAMDMFYIFIERFIKQPNPTAVAWFPRNLN
jgi:hypothetical protein